MPPGWRASTRSCTWPVPASATRSGPRRRKQLILDSRTQGTDLLARTLAGLARPPRVLLSGSAVGYYGDQGDRRLVEESPPGADFPARVCVAWEAATAPAEAAGIRVVHVRTGIVLAAHGGALHRMLLPFRLGLGGRIGSGDQYLSWIALDDHVGALLHLLTDESVHGAANLTAPEPRDQCRVHARARCRGAPTDRAADAAAAVEGGVRNASSSTRCSCTDNACTRACSSRAATSSRTRSSTTRCARCWRHRLRRDVRRSRVRGGVTEGFRTPDLRDHNPAL